MRGSEYAFVDPWLSRPCASWARHHSTVRSGSTHGEIRAAEQALDAERHLAPATADHQLNSVLVADSRLKPSHHPAQRRHRIRARQPGWSTARAGSMRPAALTVGSSFRGHSRGTPSMSRWWRRRRGRGSRRPTERRCASSASWQRTSRRPHAVGAVPQGQDVGFASGEVPRVGRPNLGRFAAGHELFLGELADRRQHRKPGMPRRAICYEQGLAHQRVH